MWLRSSWIYSFRKGHDPDRPHWGAARHQIWAWEVGFCRLDERNAAGRILWSCVQERTCAQSWFRGVILLEYHLDFFVPQSMALVQLVHQEMWSWRARVPESGRSSLQTCRRYDVCFLHITTFPAVGLPFEAPAKKKAWWRVSPPCSENPTENKCNIIYVSYMYVDGLGTSHFQFMLTRYVLTSEDISPF